MNQIDQHGQPLSGASAAAREHYERAVGLFRLYSGDDFPMVSALKGIRLEDIRHYDLFANDLSQADYPYNYVFIEPSYDIFHQYRAGNSQHPLGDRPVHRA